MKFVFLLGILILPFQFLGLVAYLFILKSDVRRAHMAGVLVPAITFFLTFLVLFLWRYYHPGMLMLGEGGINLVILVSMVIGTALHLAGGAIVHYILYRRKSGGVA